MKIKDYLTEGKHKVIKGKNIEMASGEFSSMPEYGTDSFIEFDNGKESLKCQQ